LNSKDLTQGNLAKTLLNFTFPVMLAHLFQVLYGLVDTFMVGRFADSAALASVMVGSLVMATANFMIIGLTAGGTVLIGQYLGAKMNRDADETIATMFTLNSILAVGLTIVFLLVASPILKLINTPPEAYDGALSYLRICFIGTFFTFGYNGLSSALRGMGDSKNPLLFVGIACACNIIGDFILVGPLRMGAGGAAIATTASQAISMIIGVIYLKKRRLLFDFRLKSFKIVPEKVKMLLKIGIPMGLQEALVLVSFMFIASIINRMGYVATAGGGILDKLFMVAVIPANAFSSALAAMVAQNIGADKPERAKKCLLIGMGFGISVSLVIFAVMKIIPGPIVRIFSQDADVIDAACDYIMSYAYDFLLCGIVFPMLGFINGCGRTRLTMGINIVSAFVVRVPLCYLLVWLLGERLFYLGIGFAVASITQILMATIFILMGNWKKSVISGV